MSEPDGGWVAGAPIKDIPPEARGVSIPSPAPTRAVGDAIRDVDGDGEAKPSCPGMWIVWGLHGWEDVQVFDSFGLSIVGDDGHTAPVGNFKWNGPSDTGTKPIRDEPPVLLEFNPHDVPQGPARSVYILAHKWATQGMAHDEAMAVTYPDDIVTLLRELVASSEPPTIDPRDKPESVEAADVPGPARSIYIDEDGDCQRPGFSAPQRAASPGVTMVAVLLDAARMLHTQTRELHQEASAYEHTDERRAELEAIVGDACDLAEAVVMAAARGSQR